MSYAPPFFLVWLGVPCVVAYALARAGWSWVPVTLAGSIGLWSALILFNGRTATDVDTFSEGAGVGQGLVTVFVVPIAVFLAVGTWVGRRRRIAEGGRWKA